MSINKDVLAVDFGTTNSYVSKCGLDSPRASGIDLDGGRDGMSTAILYRTGKSVLIGEKALEEFGEASAKERESYKLMVQFKPDIAKSGKARQAARDFLAQIIGTAERSNVFLDPAQKQVIFGIPSAGVRHLLTPRSPFHVDRSTRDQGVSLDFRAFRCVRL